MAEPFRFEDPAGYERMMGTWSRIAGSVFLDWLAAPARARWIDVGCGNGAFTELLVQRCVPAAVTGIDPSGAQLDFARARPGTKDVTYVQGDAMQLPFEDASFDVAVMALVLFFVPDPARGVAEMARVLRPGGLACAYAWDILGDGFPLASLQRQMRELGIEVVYPPSVEAANIDRMRQLWTGAGLTAVETARIEVERTFDSFEELWRTSLMGTSVRIRIEAQTPEMQARLKERWRATCTPDAQGRVTLRARANAVRGDKP